MSSITLSKIFAVLAVVGPVVIVALYLFNTDVVLGQLRDNPDWKVVFVPQGYFVGLYALEACAVAGVLWAWKGRHKKLLTSRYASSGKPH